VTIEGIFGITASLTVVASPLVKLRSASLPPDLPIALPIRDPSRAALDKMFPMKNATPKSAGMYNATKSSGVISDISTIL
jgi:hypothetical protein